ncbi:hypothetical protein PI95_016700 [Hassallia byssoidea VB512170]|uniref:Uncharacterized protein n=1 Tax=Hassallia byssoidea VB512170 TaxID=1304833 RepID=A0A846HAQ9_9CYAN|nr:hypothetical protein [Hassalia byssoidea]NEU74153.1 hypothetical protein [Hassalia byssoidea VB512170]
MGNGELVMGNGELRMGNVVIGEAVRSSPKGRGAPPRGGSALGGFADSHAPAVVSPSRASAVIAHEGKRGAWKNFYFITHYPLPITHSPLPN